jgi:hypothetical protein
MRHELTILHTSEACAACFCLRAIVVLSTIAKNDAHSTTVALAVRLLGTRALEHEASSAWSLS